MTTHEEERPPETRAHRRQDRHRSVRTLLDQTDDSMRRGARPGAEVWATGFPLLDSTLHGGFRSGELVLLGGGEGAGKTTFAMQVLRNAVAGGQRAVFFSYELESNTLLERLLSLESAVAAGRVGHHWSGAADVQSVRAVFEAADPDRRGLHEAVRKLPYCREALIALEEYSERLYIHESNRQTTVHEIARTVSAIQEESGEAPLVVIDYLQKVPLGEGDLDETQRTTIVTEMLKSMALELGCPVVSIVAADRESLGAGHRMRTRDLRGSSALAYEADVVLILASKEHVVAREHLVYDLGAIKRFRRWSVISVEKNRHGLGAVELEVEKDFEHGRFQPNAQVVTERLIEERIFTT